MGTIVGLGDSHFWEGSPRFEECLRIHDWIAEWVRENRPDMVVHGGDIYERRSLPGERNRAAEWVLDIAATCPMLIVGGNHDAPRDLTIFEHLRGKHPIRVVDTAGVEECFGTGIAIAAMAWPRKEQALARLGAAGKEESEQTAQALLRNLLLGLGTDLREHYHDRPQLFVGHAMVRGSKTSVGSELVGTDFELGLEDLGLVGADAYHLSHIHMHQHWEVAGAPVIYPGSAYRTSFGETEPKGFVVYRHDGQRITDWEFVETPATPMILVEAEWVLEHVGLPGDVIVPTGFGWMDTSQMDPGAWAQGAEIRFRYHVYADQRESARLAAREYSDRLRDAGAVSIKVEEQVHQETRARAPEIGQAKTLREKLEAQWKSRDFDPGDRRESLLSKLDELEEAHRAA